MLEGRCEKCQKFNKIKFCILDIYLQNSRNNYKNNEFSHKIVKNNGAIYFHVKINKKIFEKYILFRRKINIFVEYNYKTQFKIYGR